MATIELDFNALNEAGQRLESADKRGLLEKIGARVSATAQGAFVNQRLGEIEWPEQYPGMEEPFLHIAGAISDLSLGFFVRPARFARRPALFDEGHLARSITHRVDNDTTVVIGSALEYAPRMQLGLPSTQFITQTTRQTLAQQLRQEKGDRKEALKKLGWLFTLDEITTTPAERPFLGIDDDTRIDLRELGLDFVRKTLQGDTAA